MKIIALTIIAITCLILACKADAADLFLGDATNRIVLTDAPCGDEAPQIYRAYAVGEDGVFDGCWHVVNPPNIGKVMVPLVTIKTDVGITFTRPLADFKIMGSEYARY